MKKITLYNRYEKKYEEEKVLGVKAIEMLYSSFWGKLLNPVITKPFISRLYGEYQDSTMSAKAIAPFIRDFSISAEDFDLSYPYRSFNDFFIRPFKKGRRQFVLEKNKLAAPAEGRYLGWREVEESKTYPVKGVAVSLEELLGSKILAQEFCGGPMMIARLCPVDYHRFHFPDDGKVLYRYSIKGKLDSVNPIALYYKKDIFLENCREITIIETSHFGKLALIDVGATCVGKIVQTYRSNNFKRGEEKGYFLFGGSTVIILGMKGSFIPSTDILEQTQKGSEVFVRLGDEVAQKVN